jgi:branched-chain amino acid transport system substrate-binding protein
MSATGLAVLTMALGACTSGSQKAATSPTTASASPTTAASGTSTAPNAATARCASTPGVNATTLKIGVISPQSGKVAAARAGFLDGVEAAINLQNAQGGVDGRHLTLVSQDDQGSVTGNLAAAQDLVQNADVLGIIETEVQDGSGTYLATNDIPVVGHSSTPAFVATNKNALGILGAYSSTTPYLSAMVSFMKSQGVTTIAVLSHADPQSANAAKIFARDAASSGIRAGYTRLDVPLVPGDFTGDATSMASGGVNGAYLPLLDQVGLALYQAATQAGVKFKVYLFPNFYDPSSIHQVASTINGTYTVSAVAPLEENLPEQQTFQHALKTYRPGAQISANTMEGWASARTFVAAVQKAGVCPTRASVIGRFSTFTNYTENGFVAPFTYGQPESCNYVIKITTAGYQPINNSQPYCAS